MNFIKQLFCKHSFIKVGSERYGKVVDDGEIILDGFLYYICECKNCKKKVLVDIPEGEEK